jgi:hypothetical protein
MHAHDPELAQIGRNIDPLPAGQHNIPRKHPQMPIFPATTFDDISGADGKTLGQRSGLAVNWRTHGTLFVCVGNFRNSNTGNLGKFRLFSDSTMTGCGLLWVSGGLQAASRRLPEHGRKR